MKKTTSEVRGMWIHHDDIHQSWHVASHNASWKDKGGSEKFFPTQLVFLALGFLGLQWELLKALGFKTDARKIIAAAP